MEKIIQDLQAKIDQIAGAIQQADEESNRIGDDFTVSTIDILEVQAGLYRSMLEVCKAFQASLEIIKNK